jgi:hypothetical protein
VDEGEVPPKPLGHGNIDQNQLEKNWDFLMPHAGYSYTYPSLVPHLKNVNCTIDSWWGKGI